MLKIGIVGLGFMGKMHYRCWKAIKNARLVAVCDVDQAKLKGAVGPAGNISGGATVLDLKGIETYTDFGQMLKKAKLDAVVIALPTSMHAAFTVKALAAGVNVFCEKPMALNPAECEKMIQAAKKAKKQLQIGHCIRFWPEYAKTRELVLSGKYGKVQVATFQRLSCTPTWSWDNWLLDGKRSGGATLDLHIHDVDFVQYLFGLPKAVFSRATPGASRDFDHIVTNYIYADGKTVTAEGGWSMTPSYGFQMSFHLVLEKATIVYDCTRTPAFRVCPLQGKAFTPAVAKGDGYTLEVAHFAKVLAGQKVPAVLTPAQSLSSVRLVEAEKKSARTGRVVTL